MPYKESGEHSFGLAGARSRHCRPTQRLAVLGASGSVGSTALDYLRELQWSGGRDGRAAIPDGDMIFLVAVSVHTSIKRLRQILSDFASGQGLGELSYAAISDDATFDASIDELRRDFPAVRFYRGEEGIDAMLEECSADTVLTAMVGASGIRSTITALRLGLKIALANKETLVTAGPAILAEEQRRKESGKLPALVVPVDSEHNGVFQLLTLLNAEHLRRVILTASGGPFYRLPPDQIARVRREAVLQHPTWSMGPKITVDSAGMVNKGLEVIEAHFLFNLDYDEISVLIHPRSLVHAAVETRDGGYLFAASRPNMVFPTAHALHYPESVPRPHSSATPPHNWDPIEFLDVPSASFPGFRLAIAAGRRGGTAPAIYNAANEVAVELFLGDEILFADIPRIMEMTLERSEIADGGELGLYLEADQSARRMAREVARSLG